MNTSSLTRLNHTTAREYPAYGTLGILTSPWTRGKQRTSPGYREASRKYQPFRNLPTTNDPLWPPKPKLFDMATEMARCRAWLGV
jgi:hypothetical protein